MREGTQARCPTNKAADQLIETRSRHRLSDVYGAPRRLPQFRNAATMPTYR
jgi:hypothetical protein